MVRLDSDSLQVLDCGEFIDRILNLEIILGWCEWMGGFEIYRNSGDFMGMLNLDTKHFVMGRDH